jgi:transposase-like protein/DNA-binding XRE family transcriptional regulator
MGIAREELYEGGKALMRERYGNGQSMHLVPVTVLEVNRGGARIRIEKSGREIIKKFADLEADHGWLDERDRKEDEKRERIRRESIIPEQPPVRLVPPPSLPLTRSLGDLLKNVAVQPPEPPPAVDPDVVAKEQGARLSLIREARDMSRGALARRAGYSEAEVGGWERGESSAPAEAQAKLAAALEVDVGELFDLDLALPDVTPFRREPREVVRNGRPSPYSEATRTEAIKAYVEGVESLESICARLGVKYSAQVGRWAQQDGHPQRAPRAPRQLSIDATLDQPLPELTPIDIAEPEIVAAPPPPAPIAIAAPPAVVRPLPLVSPPRLKATEDMRTRRSFDDAFKYEIARQYVRREKTTKQLESEHDLNPSTIHNWVALYNEGALVKPKKSGAKPAVVAPKRATPPPIIEHADDDDDDLDDGHEVVELAPPPMPTRTNGAALARTPSQPPPQLGRAVVMTDELQRLRAEVERLKDENSRVKAEAREFLRMIGARYE